MAKQLLNQDSIDITEKKVQHYLNNEVKGYAKYVIQTRALPNIMDGLRVGARKIIWAAMTGDLSKKNMIKMPSLIGDAMKQHYNHGDVSLMNTIIQLASIHVFKFAPFDVVGQIGSLRVPKCDTAPRYLHIKKRPTLDIFKTDTELFEIQVEDGDNVEPKFFLPIIPIALLWRTNSPGYGVGSRTFSYNVDSVIDNCIRAISMGTCLSDIDEIPIVPCVEGIKPENIVFNANKNSWYNVGEYIMNIENDSLLVMDLPFDVTLEKYDETLISLKEKGYILNFVDTGIDGKIRYNITFAKGRLKLLSADKWKFFQTMKLFSKIRKDSLNVIDDNCESILFFNNPYELIDVFVKKRLVWYGKRKTKTIEVIKKKILEYENRIKFIRLIISDQIVVSKRKIIDIKIDLDKFELPYEVLKQNIDKLSVDEIQKMDDEILDLKKYLHYIETTSIQEMYVSDLLEFREKYSVLKKIID